jgi:hypothetical protein
LAAAADAEAEVERTTVEGEVAPEVVAPKAKAPVRGTQPTPVPVDTSTQEAPAPVEVRTAEEAEAARIEFNKLEKAKVTPTVTPAATPTPAVTPEAGTEERTPLPTINPKTGKFVFSDTTKFKLTPHAKLDTDTTRLNGMKNTPRKSQAPKKYSDEQKKSYNRNTKVHDYLNQFDDPVSAIESAIYEVADPKSVVYKKPNIKSGEVDPLASNLEGTGGDNAKAVLAWAKNNLSVETNKQLEAKAAKVKKFMARDVGIKEGQEEAADAAMLAKREGDASLVILTDAEQAEADADAAEAQRTLDTEGKGEVATRKKADKKAQSRKSTPEARAAAVKESADQNFVKIIKNEKVDYTSTDSKGILTPTAKRNVERAESFANASSNPEGNLKQLAEVLAAKRFEAKKDKAAATKKAEKTTQDVKEVKQAEKNLDKGKKPKPKTREQKVLDVAVEKFTKVKGITRADVLAAYRLLVQDVRPNKRADEAKKFFADATPETIKDSAETYAKMKVLGFDFLELDIDVVTAMDSNLSTDVRGMLKNGDLQGALTSLQKSTSNRRVKQIISSLSEFMDGVTVRMVTTKELEALGYTASTDDSVLAGAYDQGTNTILLNSDVPVSMHTLLHESTHAATAKILGDPNNLTTKNLQKLFDDLEGSVKDFYGVTNLREFVAEAFSNPEFQRRLADINVKGKDYTFLQRFFDTITNLLRRTINRKENVELKGSALKAVDQAILTMLAPTPETRNIKALSELQSGLEGRQRLVNAISDLAKEGKDGSPPNVFFAKLDAFLQSGSILKNTKKTSLRFLDMQALGDAAQRYGMDKIGYDLDQVIGEQRSELRRNTEKVDEVSAKFAEWANSVDSKVVDSFNTLIYSTEFGATIFNVDPSLTKVEAKKKYEGKKAKGSNKDLFAVWQAQQKHWNAIGPKGHAEFNRQRSFYKKMYRDLIEVINGQIDLVVGDNIELGTEMKSRVFKEITKRGEIDVYFPLVREGQHKLSYTTMVDGKPQPVFLMFETKAEAMAAKRQAENDSSTVDSKAEYYDGDFDINGKDFVNAPSGSFVADVLDLFKANSLPPEVQSDVMQLFISALPETSFAKSLQGRTNTYGYIPNAAIALHNKGYSLSSQIAKLRGSAKLKAIEAEIKRLADNAANNPVVVRGRTLAADPVTVNLIRDELLDRARFARVGAKNKTGLFSDFTAKRLNQVAFIYTIGFNASSAIVNLSQIPLFIIPNLSPRFGLDATMAAFSTASSTVSSTLVRIDKEYDTKEVEFTRGGKTFKELQVTLKKGAKDKILALTSSPLSPISKKEAEAMVAAKERLIPIIKLALEQGLIDTTVNMDVSAVADTKGGPKKTAFQNLTSLTSWGSASAYAFNLAEKFNRQTTLLATYDLVLQQMEVSSRVYSARESAFVDVPSSSSARMEMASREALYLTHETNGGATLETTPSIIREGIGRVAGMYKSYGMRMYTTMVKSFMAIVDKVDPTMSKQEVRAVKVQAAQQLINVTASSIVFAGVQGVPLAGMAMLLVDLFNEEFEDEDDVDARGALLYAVDEMLYKGPLSYYSGVDVSSRIALTNLLFGENRYLNDPEPEELIGLYFGGPAWSTAKRFYRAGKDFKKGEVQRGVENLLPAGLTNLARTLPVVGRYREDRAMKTRKEGVIYGGLTEKDLLFSALGFPPIGYTLANESASRLKKIDVAVGKRKSDITSKYTLGYRRNDIDMMDAALKEALKFNADWPELALSPTNFTDSVTRAMKSAQKSYNGVYLSDPLLYRLRVQAQKARDN